MGAVVGFTDGRIGVVAWLVDATGFVKISYDEFNCSVDRRARSAAGVVGRLEGFDVLSIPALPSAVPLGASSQAVSLLSNASQSDDSKLSTFGSLSKRFSDEGV